MGRLLALELARAGSTVTLFDRDAAQSGSAAAWTAAGMLAPYAELESSEDLVYRMGMESLGLWPALAEELGDIGLRAPGTLVVAHTQDRVELRRFQLSLEARLGGAGRGFHSLSRESLGELEPALSTRFSEALYLPDEACVDNVKVMAALGRALPAAGVAWYARSLVQELRPGEVTSGGEQRRFDWVIDCRGMGAKRDLPGLRGVRGEMIQVSAPDVRLRHMVRLMHPRYRLYLVPGEGDSYLLGATQIESEDYSPLSVRSALELLSALYSVHEGFGEARVLGSRRNCRPALPDNLPRIKVRPGLLRVNGLFRHGFLLAPVLARQLRGFLAAPAAFTPAWPGIFEFEQETEETDDSDCVSE